MKLLNNALNKKLCLLVLCFLGIKPFCSAVPMLISFQGHVLKESRPFEGTGQFKFAVVDQGGMTLWRNDGLNANGEPAQSIGIQVVRGVFAVTLGDDAIANMAALNSGVFDQDYISIRIWFDAGDGVFEQLSPDTRITAVGFALKAKTVDELPDGIVSKANLVQALKDAIDLNTAKVSITSDQGDTISTNTASIGTNATAISAESTRAQAAETTNATNISGNAGDITTNTASIGTNATAISAESTRAQAAEIENTVEIAQLKQHVNTSSGGTGVVVASGSKSDGSLVGQGYTQITNIEAPPWRNGIANGQPSRRHRHAGDWTGSRFLVWGGNLGGNYYSQDGGIYDPAKDVWSQISTFGSPAARDSHTAVWSGSGLIVWGGYGQAGYLASGGGFNPATGDWRSLETLGQPSPRIGHVSVLGRNNLLQINLAGGYALERAIYVDNLVQGVELNEGDKLVFSGGGQLILTASASTGTTVLNGHLTGGDLADNEKGYLGNQEVVTINNSNGYTLVRQVTVDSLDSPLSSGAVAWFSNGASLELTQNASSMDTQIHGIQRNGDLANNDVGHRHLIPIWGGKNSEGLLGDGAVYDPLADTWTAINNSSAPGKRTGHTAVWLNGELLVWGGDGETGVLNTGGRYSFAGDSWTALPTAGAPSARRGHTAISTGSTMIVWGGEAQDSLLASGSVFDPSGNSGLGSWSSMSTSNAPVARSGHSAVWTGSEMIIYGGKTVDAEDNTAAAYNPATDSWRQLTMEGPPLARKNHLAVWSGEEMLVFGGLLNGQPVGALQKLVPKQNWYLYRKN
jgi:N-acetylneuraminic acid mutarotase